LIDYVADLRAPTPTGAAEKAVPVRRDLQLTLQSLTTRLGEGALRVTNTKRLQLQALTLPNLAEVIHLLIQKLDDRTERLSLAVKGYIRSIKLRLETASKLLKSYSYHGVLERGFALISAPSGQIITHPTDAARQERLIVSFADGKTEVAPLTRTGAKAPLPKTTCPRTGSPRKKSTTPNRQGELFDEV